MNNSNMNNREAINILQRARFGEFPYSVLTIDALDMAISALEKQKKKHVKAKYLKFYDNFVYYCPVCGNVTGRYRFCSDCGQALDYANPEPYTEE